MHRFEPGLKVVIDKDSSVQESNEIAKVDADIILKFPLKYDHLPALPRVHVSACVCVCVLHLLGGWPQPRWEVGVAGGSHGGRSV